MFVVTNSKTIRFIVERTKGKKYVYFNEVYYKAPKKKLKVKIVKNVFWRNKNTILICDKYYDSEVQRTIIV